MTRPNNDLLKGLRAQRAAAIAKAGGLRQAILQGLLPPHVDLTLSEALVLGLLEQGVKVFYTVFGHGSTEVGEVLRIYQAAGLVRVYGIRSEIEASHAAAALRWVTGEKAAVVTSIGPGALQALAASLVGASNGLGIWYLFGDETSEDEGFNMQQIPRHEQASFLKMMSAMGEAYALHTPGALATALKRGAATVDHPCKPAPFYLLLPMNTQAAWLEGFNLAELPPEQTLSLGSAATGYEEAARLIGDAKRVLIKVGGGGRDCAAELTQLLDLSAGVLVHTPPATGCIPAANPANMGVGGSKGSVCGNYAMENADLLIAIGTRAVCQSDCSRTGYPNVQQVINLNADVMDAVHYNRTLPLIGDIRRTLQRLIAVLEEKASPKATPWQQECLAQKEAWQAFKARRMATPCLWDAYWQREVLTQPVAIKTATDWAKQHSAITFFDAGDVQANGFQIVEDETPRQTFTETGASYMGFAVSALLATGTAAKPFFGLAITGDGSFTMNPQVLIDGVECGARGCILLLDNGRMSAISGLQKDQYGVDFATSQQVQVDYAAWAQAVPGVLALRGGDTLDTLLAALEKAWQHGGLSLIHVPVYYGDDALGGMGVYGRWNVGNWCDDVQKLRHQIGL